MHRYWLGVESLSEQEAEETEPILAPDSADSSDEHASAPQRVSRWRVAAAAAAVAGVLVLALAGSARPGRPARGFLDEVIVKDELPKQVQQEQAKLPPKPAKAPVDESVQAKLPPKPAKAPVDGSQDEDDVWTRREHPYFAAVKESCSEDLKKFCSSKSFKDRSFLKAVNCLAEKRGELDKGCADAAFGGTTYKPHPKLFKFVSEGEKIQINLTFHNDDGTNYTTPMDTQVMIGYVQAPLMYTTPSSTPIFRTWFSMVPALTQPAPKGILFMHFGGPQPSMQSVLSAATGGLFGKHTEYFRRNFDMVSVDQRGMGMSAMELLYGIPPDTFSDYKKEMGRLLGAVSSNGGELFSSINISVSDEKPDIIGETPCKMEEAGLSDFFLPFDYASKKEVEDWLDKRARAVRYCSDKFDKDDGTGKKYSPLQFVGTGALTYDMEYMRLAFGGPKISIVGFSYGTRVAAAYASAFPYNMQRMGVTGTMAPIPDLVEYAEKAARNTAEILGWIVSQCAMEEDCSKNPWPRDDPNITSYYEGDIDDAVNELMTRSMNGGKWYKEHCGEDYTPMTLKGLTQMFQQYLTTSPGFISSYQNSTWPYGFAALPALVYAMLGQPCEVADIVGSRNMDNEAWSSVSVFEIIPALDMTGRFSKTQAVAFFTAFAKDPLFAPGLNMFSLYASNTYGWPQLPMPIGFSNQNVPAVIANGLYDERTGMAYAQDFKLHFPNSSLVTSLSGGHCVSYDQGAEAWELLLKFLANGSMPLDGTVTGHYIPIDFALGKDIVTQVVTNGLF